MSNFVWECIVQDDCRLFSKIVYKMFCLILPENHVCCIYYAAIGSLKCHVPYCFLAPLALQERSGHCIPCGNTVTEYLYNTRMHFRLDFKMEVNNINPDKTAPLEQSDLGPYCLQYMLAKNKQMRESRDKS